LTARPEWFPWLKVAERELTETPVIGLDVSVVLATLGRDLPRSAPIPLPESDSDGKGGGPETESRAP
jgi:hypothetical protein